MSVVIQQEESVTAYYGMVVNMAAVDMESHRG